METLYLITTFGSVCLLLTALAIVFITYLYSHDIRAVLRFQRELIQKGILNAPVLDTQHSSRRINLLNYAALILAVAGVALIYAGSCSEERRIYRDARHEIIKEKCLEKYEILKRNTSRGESQDYILKVQNEVRRQKAEERKNKK